MMSFQLKLLIEKKTQKVLFAEVSKYMVDFLFRLLSLPIGSVAMLITEESTLGPLRNTYRSWEKLDLSFLSSSQMKANNLIPVIPLPLTSLNYAPFLSSTIPATAKEKVYGCKCNCYFTDVYYTKSKSCQCYMTKELSYVGTGVMKEKIQTDGYVKVGLTYFLMDDLSMMPMTPLESFALVSKMGHNDFSLLEEKTVSLDFQQGLELLKLSFRSNNVLTDMFLAKKKDGHAEEAK